ncbi:hypothetical protein WH47_08819 [Habropoda laboriosa]|uniref:Uncharacterized protein n=1 Tax=Habropoda laboriosa TaxID=597456 RepID=A0A0L7R6P8_9HYME|nr:hypothetical protein WH47_08819 [Habropoda laboriosa]
MRRGYYLKFGRRRAKEGTCGRGGEEARNGENVNAINEAREEEEEEEEDGGRASGCSSCYGTAAKKKTPAANGCAKWMATSRPSSTVRGEVFEPPPLDRGGGMGVVGKETQCAEVKCQRARLRGEFVAGAWLEPNAMDAMDFWRSENGVYGLVVVQEEA